MQHLVKQQLEVKSSIIQRTTLLVLPLESTWKFRSCVSSPLLIVHVKFEPLSVAANEAMRWFARMWRYPLPLSDRTLLVDMTVLCICPVRSSLLVKNSVAVRSPEP